MHESLKMMTRVPSALLRERIEQVKPLRTTELGSYELVKDQLTGEHFLLHDYIHLNIADGSKETYYQLLPLESDDVLAIMFGEQPYDYPDAWNRPFLRNAEGDAYVWFDPAYADEYEQNSQTGEDIRELLADFKRQGDLSEAAVRRLMERMDDLRKGE